MFTTHVRSVAEFNLNSAYSGLFGLIINWLILINGSLVLSLIMLQIAIFIHFFSFFFPASLPCPGNAIFHVTTVWQDMDWMVSVPINYISLIKHLNGTLVLMLH